MDNMNKSSTTEALSNADAYLQLNAKCKIDLDFDADRKAAEVYLNEHILPNTRKFSSIEERFHFLIDNNYYEAWILEKYSIPQLEALYEIADSYKYVFPSFMSAVKFYGSYALRTFDNKTYLEGYADRAVMNTLLLADGNFELAQSLIHEIMSKRFQPATPTFLNAGKKSRGEYVSCYLMRTDDNMESIGRVISTSLQLSKRGGGVAICLTNLREFGAPIKKMANQATGVIPVMKLLEDTFSYANQLGQRPGAGAVYLNAHHPDIMTFLDTKRENADEKVRIKSLSLGVVIPDVTFELAKNNEEMALFSPYDVEREYGVPFSDISVTKEYRNMLNNPNIRKKFVGARKLFQTIAELHFESGYPYILYDDTTNEVNPHPGRIIMSNLCSEIVQVNTQSTYNEDLSFKEIGNDVSCNLGSLNIDKMVKAGAAFESSVETAIRALDFISHESSLDCAPSIKKGNSENHALGLGAMNLHGFLATHHLYYDSPEAVDFTNMFFYKLAFSAFKASNKMAKERGAAFKGFAKSTYADGSYFAKYTDCDPHKWTVQTDAVQKIFDQYGFTLPSQEDWKALVSSIKEHGLANSHLLAVAPTGSISYLSACTPSLQPVVAPIEVRKEGLLGRVYVPAYEISGRNLKYYMKGAYELGPDPIIDIASAAQQHVDQAISLTLFMKDTATTRDLNKAYIRAFKKKCKSIYYVRIRQDVLEGSEGLELCETCMI